MAGRLSHNPFENQVYWNSMNVLQELFLMESHNPFENQVYWNSYTFLIQEVILMSHNPFENQVYWNSTPPIVNDSMMLYAVLREPPEDKRRKHSHSTRRTCIPLKYIAFSSSRTSFGWQRLTS